MMPADRSEALTEGEFASPDMHYSRRPSDKGLRND